MADKTISGAVPPVGVAVCGVCSVQGYRIIGNSSSAVVVVGAGDGGVEVSHYGYIKSKKPRGSDAARKEGKPIVDGSGRALEGYTMGGG